MASYCLGGEGTLIAEDGGGDGQDAEEGGGRGRVEGEALGRPGRPAGAAVGAHDGQRGQHAPPQPLTRESGSGMAL